MTCGRSAAVVRVVKLLRYLEGRSTRPTAKVLGERYRVHARTIKRDLAALREAGESIPELYASEQEQAAI